VTTPSTANAKDGGETVRPVVEAGAIDKNATHAVVKGEVAPRLPHERDQSPDSQSGEPSELIKKAADDMTSGQADEPPGPETQQHYSELTEEARATARPPGPPPSTRR
jgi:hypothetical protein